jgi:two-component system cell cycle sensor histidine kinase/response regulator CckA
MATILIVDDHPVNREFLGTVLGYGGHRLLQAADGAAALVLAHAERPDLIIADLLMPTMDGYELVRQLRANAAVAQIPVVFCTAHYLEHEARTLAQQCGVSHILTKPCEPEEVLRVVNLMLGHPPPAAAPAAPAVFDRDHLRLLTDKLAENVQALRQTNEQLSALVEFSLQLASEHHPDRLLEALCHTARELTGARYAVVGMLGEDKQMLQRLFTSGMDTKTAAHFDAPWSRQGLLGTLLVQPRTCRRAALPGDPLAVGLPSYHPPVHSLLAAPIASPARVYGWLCLTNKLGTEEFSAADEQLTGILAALVGRIYESARLYIDAQSHALELEEEIAERRRTEAALQEREWQLRALFDSTMNAITITDDAGVYLEANPAACVLLGLAKEQLLGRRFTDFATPDAALDEVWQLFRDQGQLRTEFRLQCPDGMVRDVECQAVAHFIPGRHLLMQRDVTEHKRLEAQLLQAQKIDAIGRLAGGVAHDFNNMLTIIKGYGELLLENMPPQEPQRRAMEEINKAADRSATLTQQLLAFSRKQTLQPVILNLNTVVAEVSNMLRRLVGEDIALLTRLEPALGLVKVDPGQIEQIIINLAVNARAAMPAGGMLSIETTNVEVEETYLRLHPEVSPGAYVRLIVSDTGHGMDNHVKAHLFEPFFTTKAPGQGTGLGLASVYGMVTQSGGHIAVYSEPGQGATFMIYLPRVADTVVATPPPAPAAERRQGTETILLVEDDAAVRELLRHVLETNGYTVLEASQGEEAIALYEHYKGVIHLLVTDVVMPGMSGPQLAERLVAARPGMKVLCLSGYTEHPLIHRGVFAPEMAFLHKPFTPPGLLQKVREVLGPQDDGSGSANTDSVG